MTDDEFRALVKAGPCVVMVAKADMLRLLDERAALRAGLDLIERSHIPSQPMTTMMDDLVWAQMHVGRLRAMASAALKGKSVDD